MKPKIFIDGEHGTTGLQIRARLAGRDDVDVISIPADRRKDAAARADFLRAADIAILCLPDDAARESVALIGDAATRVIDASTAHRVADGWTYGFPEMDSEPGEEDRRRKAGRQSRLLAAGTDRDVAPARQGRACPCRLSDHHERHFRLFGRRPPDGRGL